MNDSSGTMVMVVGLAVVVLMVAGFWKMFQKAGKPGWAAIVPIYNCLVLLDIAGKPMWWIILLLIPVVNIVVLAMMVGGIATNFGKGTGFAVGLFFLGPIFYPILGFGDATYSKSN